MTTPLSLRDALADAAALYGMVVREGEHRSGAVRLDAVYEWTPLMFTRNGYAKFLSINADLDAEDDGLALALAARANEALDRLEADARRPLT